MSRAYYFTVDGPGTVAIDLTRIDQNQASFSVAEGSCPTLYDNLKSTQLTFSSAGDFYVYIYYIEGSNTNIEHQLDVVFTPIPTANAIDDMVSTPFNTAISGNVITNDSGPSIQVITGSTSTPSNGTLTIQSNGNFTYTPNSGFSGTDSFEYTIQDSDANQATASVTIIVDPPTPINAVNDIFLTQINVEINGNLLTNDSGDGISIISNTTPSNDTFTINSNGDFTFRPITSSTTDASFTYTIRDSYGNSDTATVTIQIDVSTDFQEGLQDFILINPQSTRNILGSFATLGNTVECITEKRGTDSESNSYDGTCQNSTAYNDNNYMAKYIDIDDDDSTWNSSSSNFTLPDSYNQDDGKGILWAGLFWQGGINNSDSYKQRRAYVDGNSYSYKYITSNQDINLESTDGNKVLMKIDTNGTYENIQAHTFYYDKAFGDRGGYYAAYADVTAYFKNKNLAIGDHTITLANITANEGRQSGTGNYAGWSLIVIYKESPLPGVKARNISIYNGYTTIQSGVGTRSVNISGFKLPSTGTVNAQFSAFAGEGEYVYGTPNGNYDRMIISSASDFNAAVTYGMPGAGVDQNNIFDAILANIDRDNVGDNAMTGNNNGIDIENYDVTEIMSGYRDVDPNIEDIYIGLSSNNDYITPSMMGFSAELYKPQVCYDYTVQRNNFDITQDNRTIETRSGGELSINIALESLEGDFDLEDAQIAVNLSPVDSSSFSEAFYAPNNVNTFIPAIYIDDNSSKPLIALGENISNTGGTIRIGQRYFSKFLFDLNAAYSGKFEVSLISTIDYGSGAVPSVQSTEYSEIPRCPQSDVYNPAYGYFNVERRDSIDYDPVTAPNDRFPLYTQVVGRDFDVSLVAYDANATPAFGTELALSGYTIDLELINAKPFNDDKAQFICNNPDASIIKEIMPGVTHKFINFPSTSIPAQSRVDLSESVQTDTALRNAAFRMWYLVDVNNTIIPHECVTNDIEDEACFEQLYADNIQPTDNTLQADGTVGFCQTACTNGGSDCYQCLRDFHAKVVCSRDNFSIRPASYRVKISDNAQSTDETSTEIELGQNNDDTTSVATIAAGYNYKLDAIATSYLSDTTLALGYTRDFTVPSSTDLVSTLQYDTSSGAACVDTNNTDWEVHFENGILNGTDQLNNLVIHSNVGDYNYHIEDSNWTLVDQSRYAFKTFPNIDDCDMNSNAIVGGTDKSGCKTDSTIVVNGATYTDLALTYRPYEFNLENIQYVKHPDVARSYTYLNNFDNDYYSDLLSNPVDMSISFEGNISALGKNDILLTNFTDGCAAEDITLRLIRQTSPDESVLYDSIGNLIELQQYLQHTSINNAFSSEEIGIDKNITVPKAAFRDVVNSGKASIFLHTTFKKPLNAVIDPFDIQYQDLNVSGGVLLQSSADLGIHVPDGNKTFDQNITYYFAKVTPQFKVYENVTTTSHITPIYIDIYCSTAPCVGYPDLNLSSQSTEETEDWHDASPIFDNLNDGTTDLVAGTDAGGVATPSVTPNDDVTFTSGPASRTDIEVSVAGPARPTTVGIDIQPVPWLLYDPVNAFGYPHYQVQFIDSAGWSGVGNTGSVVETRSSSEAQRMNW